MFSSDSAVNEPQAGRLRKASFATLLTLFLISPWVQAQEEPTSVEPSEEAAVGQIQQSERDKESAEEPGEKVKLVVRESVDVVAEWPPGSAIHVLTQESMPMMPLGDGADLLRDLSGVAIGRMGGHGLEPRIRGLGESNLNILIDGAFVHGGCPNRMDPPTSFAATSGFDRITVLKGMQSLRYGPGGNGGTVLFERRAPLFSDDQPWFIGAFVGHGGWREEPEVDLEAIYARSSFYLRANADSRSLDNYEDGDGEVVRSGFDSRASNLMLGFGDRSRGFFEVGFEQSRTDDALFAGAGMDSPSDRGGIYRLKFGRSTALGVWRGLQADLYYSDIEHLMDNYSLRPLSAPMAMRVPSTSDTFGGRVSAEMDAGANLQLTLGFDYQQNQRQARRFAGPDPGRVTMLQSVMWPDAEIIQGGFYAEGERRFPTGSRVRFGGRLDAFEASAADADLKPVGMNRTANELYRLYYGQLAEPWSDTGWSALARYDYPIRSGWTLVTGVSRSLRAADATERYLGANSSDPKKRWIGNPQLATSIHYQLDLGIAATAERHEWSATAFFDEVEDFILRDRAHGQKGVLLADSASVYRNVDARLLGMELDGRFRLSSDLELIGNVSWVRGENRTDSRPLAQIPPLQGVMALAHGRDPWSFSAAVRWALEQRRVDDDPSIGSGQDFGRTPGHASLDLEGMLALKLGFEILLGLDNVFDETYAEHLNRGNLFDPDPVRVNEPGRAAWLRLRWRGGAG